MTQLYMPPRDSKHLPEQLRKLVGSVLTQLGEVIKESEGAAFYRLVDKHRLDLQRFRSKPTFEQVGDLYNRLKRLSPQKRLKLAHAFSLLLELINVCEAAYRTYRLAQRETGEQVDHEQELYFVLTAHPTEARSKATVEVLTELTQVLANNLMKNDELAQYELATYIRLLWQLPLIKQREPTVMLEADYIYSAIFSNDIFNNIFTPNHAYHLKISTWVGGDKDGHPGVNASVMLASLSKSRRYFIQLISGLIAVAVSDLAVLSTELAVKNKLEGLASELKKLSKVSNDDGKLVLKWQKKFMSVLDKAAPVAGKHFALLRILTIFDLFPMLVVPLQIRENAPLIHDALKQTIAPIRLMLKKVHEISKGVDATHYVQGFVISHCLSQHDISAAYQLTHMTRIVLPIVPLFEDKVSISNCDKIIADWFTDKKHLAMVKTAWHNHMEIMLGYSDSSKEIGVLPSRLLICSAMQKLEKVMKKHGVKPIFFHGAGGSVDRGGGSIEEQVAWWPDSAVMRPKMTVQGEMVQRSFATSEIFHSQCSHLSSEFSERLKQQARHRKSKLLSKFSSLVEECYLSLVNDDKLLTKLLSATPYQFLEKLKIGSRPSKRHKNIVGLSHLRAIPWVLCWTQTRTLMPTWWGVGRAWQQLGADDKRRLQQLSKTDPFFSNFIKTLGFALTKVDMLVWRKYLEGQYGQDADTLFKPFEDEYKRVLTFMRAMTGGANLLPHKRWLQVSVTMRSPYVLYLNMLQIIAMKSGDEVLLKETLVGIACGMLTTG